MSEAAPSDWEARRDAKAKALGMEIHYPERDELFVDIDNAESLKSFHECLALLGDLVLGYTRTPSNGGGDHWHIRVKLWREVDDDAERIALQALLGSDRKREMLSWITKGANAKVTCFFERPKQPNGPADAAPESKPF
jgi:hypothetical protein